MLSLASNISSTQAVEAKYSAVFDGTDDFVDCGLIDFNTNDFSVSCWIKVREWTQYSVIWGNRSDSSTNNIGVALRTTGVTGELQLFSDWGTPTDSSIVTGVPADTWVHVVCTGDRDGNQVIYLNHDDATTTTDISDRSSVDFTSNLEFRIGRSHGTLYHNMSISQLGIWNVVLSANAVEALYNNGKPINLRINQGNYTSSSALQQYYKFGNGSFDDKANGIIHDQDNPGFTSELLKTPDFSNSGTLSTTTLSSLGYNLQTSGSGATTAVVQNGELTINVTTPDGNAGRVFMQCADGVTLTEGNRYKATYTIVSTSDFDGSDHFSIWDGNSYETVSHAVGTNVVYFAWTGVDRTSLPMQLAGQNSGAAGIVFSDLSLVKLNGNPGITSGGITFSSDTP